MLKKWIEITTKYQKEILIAIIIFVILYVLYKKRQKTSWLAPNYPISSKFKAPNRPTHNGTDYYAQKGSPILAIGKGIVEKAAGGCVEGDMNCNGQNGNFVKIDHQNGYKSIYLHLSEILVQTGQKVKKGQIIGSMGNTGHSFGTHLHLSVTKDNQYIDPEKLFNS